MEYDLLGYPLHDLFLGLYINLRMIPHVFWVYISLICEVKAGTFCSVKMGTCDPAEAKEEPGFITGMS